jgi:hypothetical protein
VRRPTKWSPSELHRCNLGVAEGQACWADVSLLRGVMSKSSPFVIVLSVDDGDRLEAVVPKRTASQRDVQRARIVLAAGDALDNVEIAEVVGVDVNTVSKWRKRFFEEGIEGLSDRHRSGRPRTFSPSGGCRGERARLRTPGHVGGAVVAVELQRARS